MILGEREKFIIADSGIQQKNLFVKIKFIRKNKIYS